MRRDLRALPKAHLHVPLESTVRPATLRELAAGNGLPVPPPSRSFAGLADFVDHNGFLRDCLRRPSDFRRVARELLEDEAAQGTRHVEVSFSAAAHGERLGDLEMPLSAVLDGLREADTGVRWRLLLDTSRRRSVERGRLSLRLATAFAGDGVVGIGLAGDESYPLAPFEAVLDEARSAGLHLVHHAGEACGADSIREAVHIGHTERLGHGIRVLDDPARVDEVRGIPLEVCPTSNVALGFVPSFREHPLPRLRDAGLTVTINTDIPAVVGTTLVTEYEKVRAAFGYDDLVMAELARNSFDASFAGPDVVAAAHRDIDEWIHSGQ